MTIIPDRLRALLDEASDRKEAADIMAEVTELVRRHDELETILIMLVRTGWPWDEEGEPNAIFHASRPGYTDAIRSARDLLGLGQRSRITRTEPKT